jgi:hypothetical protein
MISGIRGGIKMKSKVFFNGLYFEVNGNKVKCLDTGGYIKNKEKKQAIIEKANQ